MASRIISKSKYLSGLQCEKLLWHHIRDRDLIPPPNASTQAVFDQGHALGDLAKAVYPEGVEIPYEIGFRETIERTQDLLSARVPLFEASFLCDDCYCRCDLLIPAGEDAWDLIEVKSGTSVKEINLHDVAFQWHVLARLGLELREVRVMFIDNEYVRDGKIDPAGLLTSLDVTHEAKALRGGVPARLENMRNAIAGMKPEIPIGPHCIAPYECPLFGHCREFLPENSVAELYRVGKKSYELIAEGVLDAVSVPDGRLSSSQRIQKRALTSGEMRVKRESLRGWLEELKYPIYFLDFETIAPAVPRFDGTRPYQQIPFQFSLHVIDEPGVERRHSNFLATGEGDPRAELVKELFAIGPTGSILAWNMSFEKSVLLDLVAAFPSKRRFLRALASRLLDLMDPFRRFWVYHPEQHGSCSLKAVLPALTGTSYADLQVRDGGQAVREYIRILDGGHSREEEQEIRRNLLAYCEQDTAALVDLLAVLLKLTASA